MSISLASRGRKIKYLPKNLEFPLDGSIDQLKEEISQKSQLPIERLRLSTVDGTVLLPGKTLRKYGIGPGTTIWVKDLGPQIGWRTVYIIEYLGPLIIHSLFVLNLKHIYRQEFNLSLNQKIAFVMVILHFLKREYESIYVHRFSSATMPFRNIFKNCFHYHVLAGVLLAFFIYGPWHSQDYISPKLLIFYTFGWTFSVLSNLKMHLKLRDLRPEGSSKRAIPYGYGFNWVSCPNYFFESLEWLLFALITRSWASWLFLAIGSAQMWVWAQKKHKRYLKEFPNYPKSRKVFIPFFM
ncbi:enoyl reductase [Schizosaccharomyces cryophilus OY26]|uniref:Enoyl reductase n=1 Tax=Schizosaccharomyces cryophilus (strain OY26 / ATCC MYA-4695 / CBS 11777 / NBRC 106824 / NRRL Y48691) TaxID=653667 RepID=S9W8S7_SCHCR|nr:enoyl reductase [Schizosaccharomyces cryophilus OY26]EPY54295.1 enoyl reductase [Schizosaccharomyces cryophilus OY26]